MNWLWKIAVIKTVKRIIQLALSWIVAQHLERYGINIDTVKLTAVIYACLELIRNYAKISWGIKWI